MSIKNVNKINFEKIKFRIRTKFKNYEINQNSEGSIMEKKIGYVIWNVTKIIYV